MISLAQLKSNYEMIRARVQKAAESAQKLRTESSLAREVTLVAVSKTQPIERIEEALKLGCTDFGENYVQELLEKAERLPNARWHFIGHLQTNKVKVLIPFIHCIHSVDSEKLGGEIAKRWRESGRAGSLPIFIQVNLEREPSKSGVDPSQARSLAERLSTHPELEVLGLMAIPTPAADRSDDEVRKSFAELRSLERSCRPFTRGALSMGMTDDFELAIQEGATHVRVGTAIFGRRD